MFLYAKVEKFQLIFSAELRQINLNTVAKISYHIWIRILFVYNHYRVATTRLGGVWSHITLSKTNPLSLLLSTQIKLYCYGVDYRAFAGAS